MIVLVTKIHLLSYTDKKTEVKRQKMNDYGEEIIGLVSVLHCCGNADNLV